MPDSPTVVRISPMIAVSRMQESLDFYCEVLGFTVVLKSDVYSIVQRDGQTVHLQHAADEGTLRAMREHTEFYIEVRGIRQLWEHVKQFADRYSVRAIFEREYGMTEFHIKDPDGILIFVGEPTELVQKRK